MNHRRNPLNLSITNYLSWRRFVIRVVGTDFPILGLRSEPVQKNVRFTVLTGAVKNDLHLPVNQ